MEENELKPSEQVVDQEPKKKGAGIIICFLILIIIGLCGYVYYKEFYKKEPAKIEEREDNKKEEAKKEENYDAYYQILDERMPKSICFEFKELYQENGYQISEMSDDVFWNWIFSKLTDSEEKEYTMLDINGIINDLVRPSSNETIDELKKASIFSQDDTVYSIANIVYTIVDNSTIKAQNTILDCETTNSFVKKIVNKVENDDTLELDVKVAYVEEEDLGAPEWYGKKASDAAKYPNMKYNEHSLETIKANDQGIQNPDLNWDLYDTYKIKFIKEDKAYYFNSISLVK